MNRAPTSRTPAAPAQWPLWLLQQLEPSSCAYNLAFHLDLEGELSVPAMCAAWRQVVARHSVIRSRLLAGEDAPVLDELPVDALPLEIRDAGEHAAAQAIANDARTPFDLGAGPPARARLYRCGEGRHKLAFAFHHAVFDGWSLNVLLAELARAYNHELGQGPALRPLASSYVEHALRSNRDYLAETWASDLDYWKANLKDAPSELELPSTAREQANPRPGLVLTATHPGLAEPLAALSARVEATPFMVLLSAYAAVLSRYTGADEVVIGTPLATRLRPKVRDLIGLFLNTVALRVRVGDAPTFLELTRRVKEAALGAFRHYQAPFERVVEAVHPQRRPGHNPLFSAMFILQNAPVFYEFIGLTHRYHDDDVGAAKFDLTLSTQLVPDDLHITLEYAADRISTPIAEGISSAFRVLLTHALESPDRAIDRLSWIEPAAARRESRRWVGPDSDEGPTPLLDAIERQARANPDAPAIESEGMTRTYGELWSSASRIAKTLAARGLGAGDRIGVRVERNAALPEILIGVMRCGAAYLPLDAGAPPARRRAALEDAKAVILLADAPEPDEAPPGTTVLNVRDLTMAPGPPPEAPPLEATAYIIYTSGSSGRPKGVEISHRGLACFARGIVAQLGLTSEDVFFASTTVGFDPSVLDLLVPLTIGARIAIQPTDVKAQGHRLAEALQTTQATVFQTTPSGLRLLMASGWQGAPNLRVLVGGEGLPRDLARDVSARVRELWNLYGPTECTVWISARRVTDANLDHVPDVVPIGGTVADARLYVLDGAGHPVPPGARGELCIAGPQVAEGYVGRPELNAARFVTDPFTPGAAMYRTGDLVRGRPDGDLDFLGRSDQQIKIRGFRVEPAEIEAALRREPGIRDAVVTIQEGPAGPNLVSFVIAQGQPISSEALQVALRRELPGYMVPASIHAVPEIPRTVNGKLDRARLPQLDALPSHSGHAPPRDQLEAQLLELWRSLLGRRAVGIHDNFFDVGGHSMLAAKLASRVERQMGRRLPVSTFFQAQTVADQAAHLRDRGHQSGWRALDPVKPAGSRIPVFYIGATDQARMLARHLPEDQPMYGLKVLGLPEDHGLNVDAVARSYVDEIVALQPEGPYAITGYCQDAKLALAVANELLARGARVARLIYIDVIWLPDLDALARRQLQHNLYELGPKYAAHWVQARAKFRLRRAAESVYDGVMKRRSSLLGQPAPLTSNHRDRLRELRANLDQHPETTFAGDLDILLCQEYHRPGAARALAWMAEGSLRVFEIPGLHHKMFDAPEVYWLASRLAKSLEDAFSADAASG